VAAKSALQRDLRSRTPSNLGTRLAAPLGTNPSRHYRHNSNILACPEDHTEGKSEIYNADLDHGIQRVRAMNAYQY
jgi:hypothetical protein